MKLCYLDNSAEFSRIQQNPAANRKLLSQVWSFAVQVWNIAIQVWNIAIQQQNSACSKISSMLPMYQSDR